MQLNHIAIWTRNLEIMKDFYLHYFDCTVNEKYQNKTTGFTSYFISFKKGGRIELMHRAGIMEKPANETTGYCHIAITVGNKNAVDQLTHQFRSDGYNIAGEPRTTGDGYYESVIVDPEGNRIELVANS